VIELQGEGNIDDSKLNSISDGNLSTYIKFDINPIKPKSITIDLGKIYEAGTITFERFLSPDYTPRYYISEEDDVYVEVSRIPDFNTRFIKIKFENTHNNDKEYILHLKELIIKKAFRSTHLVKPEGSGLIRMYANYDCTDNSASILGSLVGQMTRSTNFSIDAFSKEIEVELEDNPEYENDFDGDGILNDIDNCFETYNSDQIDSDRDGKGDSCDFNTEVKNFNERDSDKDGVGDAEDNCIYVYNPKQKDMNVVLLKFPK
jgi:hypothetical protein